MRLHAEKSEVEVEGITRTRKFSIAATGKAFKILSDGLYSNKIKAIIRELSCNAYDSHIENGYRDKPFQVHLPNRINPLFLIRDFGVGLSPRELETLYTTYFQSTKNESNDLVGCLGLGSKSPFSYTDNFTVTSWKNNQKHIYSCYLDEYGEPNIAHIKSIKSDEPSGVQVEFSVKAIDFNTFRSEAENVFKYFDITPEFTCGTFPSILKPDYKGRDWVMTKDNRDYYNRGSYAVMGNVAYPIVPESIDKSTIKAGWLLEYGIVIKFPIGSLNITPSRESLGYNEATKEAIKTKLVEIEKEIADTLRKEIDSCPNLWEARIKLLELSEEFNCPTSLLDASSFYKGERFLTKVPIYGFNNLYVRRYHKEYDKIVEEKTIDQILAPISLFRRHKRAGSLGEPRFIFNHDVTLNRPLVKRAKEYFEEHLSSNDVLYTIHYVDGYVAEKLVEKLGIDESQILHAEDVLPKKKKQNSSSLNISSPKIKSERVTVLKYTSKYANRKNKSDYWDEMTIDAAQLSGYYVLINRFSPEHPSKSHFNELSYFHYTKSQFERFFGEAVIYGIRKPDIKKAKYNPNLTDFWKFLEKEYNSGLTSDLFLLTKYSRVENFPLDKTIDALAKEFPNSDFSKYKQFKDSAKSSLRFLEKMQWLQQLFNRGTELELPTNLEFENLEKELLQKYPLLEYIPNYASEEAIKYVKLVQTVNP